MLLASSVGSLSQWRDIAHVTGGLKMSEETNRAIVKVVYLVHNLAKGYVALVYSYFANCLHLNGDHASSVVALPNAMRQEIAQVLCPLHVIEDFAHPFGALRSDTNGC